MVKHTQTIRRQKETNCFNAFDHSPETMQKFYLSTKFPHQGKGEITLFYAMKPHNFWRPYNGEVAPANLHIYFHNFSFSLWNKQSFLAREKNIKFNMFRFCLCDHFIYLVSVLNSRYVWSEKCALKKKDLADWISINSIMQIHLYCITTSHAEIYSHEPNRI